MTDSIMQTGSTCESTALDRVSRIDGCSDTAIFCEEAVAAAAFCLFLRPRLAVKEQLAGERERHVIALFQQRHTGERI